MQPALLATAKSFDCIIYLAGVLFQPHPEEFLHRTNTVYAQNLIEAAPAAGAAK